MWFNQRDREEYFHGNYTHVGTIQTVVRFHFASFQLIFLLDKVILTSCDLYQSQCVWKCILLL